jgi:hypothetical protein
LGNDIKGYFKHYEIEVQKLFLWFWRRIPRAAINNIETLNSFEPLLAPVFVIHVYNILADEVKLIEGQNQRSTNFVRRGYLLTLFSSQPSPNESVLYYSNYPSYTNITIPQILEGSTELNSSSIVF